MQGVREDECLKNRAIHGLKDRIECSKLAVSATRGHPASEGRERAGRGNDVDGQGICIQRKGHIHTQLHSKEKKEGGPGTQRK